MDVCLFIRLGGKQMSVPWSELERQTAELCKGIAQKLVNVVCMREYVDRELTNCLGQKFGTFIPSVQEAKGGVCQRVELLDKELQNGFAPAEAQLVCQSAQGSDNFRQRFVKFLCPPNYDDVFVCPPGSVSWVVLVDVFPGFRGLAFCNECLSASDDRHGE